jgi:DNA-binding NarL/FixJ family response regulator
MRKIVVMIIEGEPFFRAGLRQALSQHDGLEILECDPEAEGKTAIAQITASSPDVALLDIGYPTLPGLDLGKKIARSFPATKVVMLSANPNEDDDELFEVIKSGAAGPRSPGAS